jgi:hypothetical protein
MKVEPRTNLERAPGAERDADGKAKEKQLHRSNFEHNFIPFPIDRFHYLLAFPLQSASKCN